MTRKHRRLIVLLACGVGLGSAAALSLSAFSDNMQLFLAPSDIAHKTVPEGRTFRLGGLVVAGSVARSEAGGHPAARFMVSDGNAAVPVEYTGILPDLFREGQGVVALGSLTPEGTFRAEEVLAKHDETYMPKEVVEALKKSGRWNPTDGKPPPASTWNTLPVNTLPGPKSSGG